MESSKIVRWLSLSCIACSVWPCVVRAQSQPYPQPTGSSGGAAQSRLRPLGSPSAVDAYQPSRSAVRQVAMMQIAADAQPVPNPSLPPGGGGFEFPAPLSGSGPLPSVAPPPPPPGSYTVPPTSSPPSTSLPVPLQSAPVGPIAPPSTATSQGLPLNPHLGNQKFGNGSLGTGAPLPTATATIPVPQNGFVPRRTAGPSVPVGSSDYAAIPSPRLENAFATIDNCRNISAPSSYRAAGFFGCGSPVSYGSPVYGPPAYAAPATYAPPPAQIAPAVAFPTNGGLAPIGIAGSLPPVLPGNPGYRPLISFGQESNPVQVGQGLLGQPVAYVPGQRFRNVLRYLSF